MNDDARAWLEDYIVKSQERSYREWLERQTAEKLRWLLAELPKEPQDDYIIRRGEQLREEASKRGIL